MGVIFDMDGVIIHNHKYHVEAWITFCKKYGKPLTEDQYRDHINGKTARDIIKYLFGDDVDQEKVKEFTNEKESLYRELYAPHLALTPGLEAFLNQLYKHKIPMAVATSAPTANADFTLDGLNIRHYFQAVLDENDVVNGKPDPEIYRKASAALKNDPADCIVFEDALAGIRAGKAAGCTVIGVATSHKLHELKEADYCINNFTEVDIDKLKEIWGF